MPVVVLSTERFGLQSEMDVVAARRGVMELARQMGLNTLDRTKVVTAASELARNTVTHGKGGSMSVEIVRDGSREGIRITFEDAGPGIADIPLALQDGYSTGGSLGMGLPGARRLMSDFQLESTVGVGTLVAIARWKE